MPTPQTDIKKIKQTISLLRYAGQKTKFERRGSEYWACCPLPGHSERTPSFAIKLKEGEEVFFCQGCSKGGDLITFVELTEGLTKKDAIEKLKSLSYAPVSSENPAVGVTFAQNNAWAAEAERVTQTFTNIADSKPKVTIALADWKRAEDALASSPEAIAWLKDTRGIGLETAQRLHFGFQKTNKSNLPPEHQHLRDGGWLMFPRVAGETVVAAKQRSITAKAFTQIKDMDAKALFNSDAANALEDLFVTEGELDAAVMEQADYRAVSIPNASAKLTPEGKIIMKRACRVFLAGDNDGTVGTAAMRTLHRELGENTYLIAWPGAKDANEFFIKVCHRDITEFRKQVEALKERALSTPAEGFTSLIERMRQRMLGADTSARSNPLRLHFPFTNVDDMSYSLPGSVVTIYSTYSGTGKTVFATQVMLAEAVRGETVVVYSPEVRDDQYLALVTAQTIGPRRPQGLNRAETITKEDFAETIEQLSVPSTIGAPMQYYVGHSLPVSDGEKILDFIETVLRATGATRFVIDTLHRIVTPSGRESVVEAEGRTMRRLEELAIAYNCVFVVIGQSNKEAEDLKEVRKDAHGTLRGNREITDISDSVFLIHRKRNPAAAPEESDKGVDLLVPETTIVLVKGRVQGRTGKFASLIYKKEHSKFYSLTYRPDDANVSEPPTSVEDSLYGNG